MTAIAPPNLVSPALEAPRLWPIFRLLLVYFGIQVVVGLVLGMTAGISNGVQFGTMAADSGSPLFGMVEILSMVFGAAIAGLYVLHRFQRMNMGVLLGDSRPVVARAGLIGFALALVYCGVVLLFPPDADAGVGPLSRLAASGGLGLVGWVALVLIAPLFEEVLFRGMLFPALAARFGTISGALLSTTVFWVCHIAEVIHYVPAAVAVFAVGLAACAARQRSRGLLPCIALHLAYNASIAGLVVASSLGG